MAKYDKPIFECGEWWLQLRGAKYYGFRYDRGKQWNERRSLGTTNLETAKQLLVELHLKTSNNAEVRKQADAPLADILQHYYENHAIYQASGENARHGLVRWLEFWQGATLADLCDVAKQEEFHAYLRTRGHRPSSMVRVLNIGKAALNRAYKRLELPAVPHILTLDVGEVSPKGRPLSIEELQVIYENAAPHVRTFMEWALGTAARPQAILDLHSRQIDFEKGLVNLLPPGRKQIARKFRPTVRLPRALNSPFEGHAVLYKGHPVASIKGALWKACDRADVERCSSYSFRHTAARWMREQNVAAWEVAAQLGHSGGRQYSVTERYAPHSPDYLSRAVASLSELVELTRSGAQNSARRDAA